MFECFKHKIVVVTGHTGFKGAWLSTWLKKLGSEVVGISDGHVENGSLYNHLPSETFAKEFFIDIRDRKSLISAFKEITPDFIFHLAAQPLVLDSYVDPLTTYETNVMGTINTLEYMKNSNHRLVSVLITSDKCYENVEWIWGYKETDRLGGSDPYSSSKAMAEIAISSYFRSFLSTKPLLSLGVGRAGNVMGGGDFSNNRIVPDCFKNWLSERPVEIRSPSSTRPWQHVLEPLSGYMLLASKLFNDEHVNGEAFNFGPDKDANRNVKELILQLSADHANFKYKFGKASLHKEAGLLQLNCDKAYQLIRWKPTLSFEEACLLTKDWYIRSADAPSSELVDLTISQISHYEKLAETRQSITL